MLYSRIIQLSFAHTGMRPLDLKAATLLRSSSLLLKGTASTVGQVSHRSQFLLMNVIRHLLLGRPYKNDNDQQLLTVTWKCFFFAFFNSYSIVLNNFKHFTGKVCAISHPLYSLVLFNMSTLQNDLHLLFILQHTQS